MDLAEKCVVTSEDTLEITTLKNLKQRKMISSVQINQTTD